jgi:hypothetical protein
MKAYTSVVLAAASSVMSGASMWLDAPAGTVAATLRKKAAPRARRCAGHRVERWSVFDKLRVLFFTTSVLCWRANREGRRKFDFRRHLRRAAELFPQPRYGVSFRKVSVKRVSVKKKDDAGRKSRFRSVVPLPSFRLRGGRMSDTALGKACGQGRVKGRAASTDRSNKPLEDARTHVDRAALMAARVPTAAPGAAPQRSDRRTSSTLPRCEAAKKIRPRVSGRARLQGSATCRPG